MTISTALQKYTALLMTVVLLTAYTTCNLSWGMNPHDTLIPTGATDVEAAIGALATQNVQLSTQVAELEIQKTGPTPAATPVTPVTVYVTIAGTQEATPAPSPTPLPTAIPSTSYYHPVALDPLQANAALDLAMQPMGDVVLGSVPFQLSEAVFKSQASTPPYDHGPTGILLKQEVPYAHELHLLLNAGNGFNEFKGQVIGQVIAYCDGAPLWVSDLRLGQEIREWHTGDNVVSTATRAQQVWTAPIANMTEKTGYIDMLTLDLPAECRTGALTAINIVDTSATTIGSLDPALNLIGVTVSTQPSQQAEPGAEKPDNNATGDERAAEELRAQFEATLAQLQRPYRKSCIGYKPEDEEAKRAYEARLTEAIAGLLTHPLAQSLDMPTLAAICSSENHQITSFSGAGDALLVVMASIGDCVVGSHDPGPGMDVRVFERTGQSWFIGHAGRILPENIRALNGGWAMALDLSSAPEVSKISYTAWHIEKNGEWGKTYEFPYEYDMQWSGDLVMDMVNGQPRILITYARQQTRPPCQFDAEFRSRYHKTSKQIQRIYTWDGENYVDGGPETIVSRVEYMEDDRVLVTEDSWQEHCIADEPLPNPGWTRYAFIQGAPVDLPDVEDGLKINCYDIIESIAVAPDGSLWTPTSNGLLHFEGNVWRAYKAPNGFALLKSSLIAVAGDGTVWISTSQDIAHFDGNTWVTHTRGNEPNGRIREIDISPDNVVWLGTNQGVFRLENGEWTQHLNGVEVNNIAAAPGGVLWASDYNHSEVILRFDGTWQSYASTYINDIAIASDGAAWIGSTERTGSNSLTYPKVLIRRDAQTPDQIAQVIRDIPQCGSINTIAAAPDGSIWVGGSYGAYHYSLGQWTVYNNADGLIYPYVYDIEVAPDGSVWFATLGGISHYTP